MSIFDAIEFAPAIRFRDNSWNGYISGGKEHGVELTRGIDFVSPVTRAMCLNLEHYYATDCVNGMFVPRYKASRRSRLIGDRTVRIEIESFEEWRVRSTVTLRLLEEPARTIEAEYDFTFERGFEYFECLVSNYFHEKTPPFLHLGGQWVRVELDDSEHRSWMRSPEDAARLRRRIDGQWPEIRSYVPNNDVSLPIDSECYSRPVMVSTIADTGWSVVNVVEPEHCPSLSANRRFWAHDFSILGRPVAAGERVRCRAWLAYAKLDKLGDALAMADRLLASPRQGA